MTCQTSGISAECDRSLGQLGTGQWKAKVGQDGVVPRGRGLVGACRGVDPEVFFGPADSPEGGPMLAWELRALAVCHRCPVVEACLQAALEFPAAEQHGVVGGMTAGQRRQVLRLSRRRPTRSYLAGRAGLSPGVRVSGEVDEMVVARLMAGDRVTAPRRGEVAQAAVELARVGHGVSWIAARLGEHERQVSRWLHRRPAEHLVVTVPRLGRPVSRPEATQDGAVA